MKHDRVALDARRDEWIRMRQLGWSLRAIAEQGGVSPSRVHQVTGTVRRREPQPAPIAAPIAPKERRAVWTFPDADLLKLAHEVRDEIRKTWSA